MSISKQMCFLASFVFLASCDVGNIKQMQNEVDQAKKEAEKKQLHQSKNEDQIVDEEKQGPVKLLLQAYKNNRILLLGHSGHFSSQHLFYLLKLLKEIGNDPKLKYIILERPADNDSLYEQLSVKDILKDYKFKSELSKDQSLCATSEWAYAISEFMPRIRELNNLRSPHQPLLVKVIDSVKSEVNMMWPGLGKEVSDGSCSAKSISNSEIPALTLFQSSGNREVETSLNFETKIWKNLKSDEKVIIVYHHAHLLTGFKSCFPFMLSENEWIANSTPMNWMSHFLDKYPLAKKDMDLILFDYNVEGNYKFAERQLARHPNEAIGISLNPFKNILLEQGLDAFLPSSMLASYHNGQHHSNLTLPELASGMIMSSVEYKDFGFDEDPARYLPEYCSAKFPN